MSIITIGAIDQAGEIPGNGCLAFLEDVNTLNLIPAPRRKWIFKAPPTPATVGAGTEYPVGMSLDQLMEMYWRWKKLKFDFALTANPLNLTNTTITINNMQRTHFNGTAITTPAVMVRGMHWANDHTDNPPGTTPSPDEYYNFNVNIFGGDPVVYYTSADKKYWPYFKLTLIMTHKPAFYESSARMSTFIGGSYTQQVSNLTLKLSSGNLTVSMYSPPDDTASFTAELSCTEFWQHQNLDGTPKWHATTGAKL